MNKGIRCTAILLLGGALAVAQQRQQNTKNPAARKSANAQKGQSAGCANQATENGAASNHNQTSEMQRSGSALRVIADTNQARSAISQKNQANAKSCIADALHAISTMPNRTTGQNADNQASANLVPIYTELGEVTVLGPVSKQQQLKQSGQMGSKPNERQSSGAGAQGSANRSSTGQASNAAKGNGGRQSPTGVTGVAQEFTSVSLDMNTAKNHLQAAETAMQNGDTKAADAALAAVQESVVMVEVAADRPLLKARENLMLARNSAQQGQYKNLNGPLTAAANALDTYASTGTQHAKDARDLSAEIRSYARTAKSQNANNSDALQNIDNWWEKVRSWTSQQ